jgi:WD40 repeat protein
MGRFDCNSFSAPLNKTYSPGVPQRDSFISRTGLNIYLFSVWGCTWHSCGDFLASSSMDMTAKVWDLNSLRCRYTLRGHTDSVNSIEFLPYSNTLLTCSADKTIYQEVTFGTM